MKDKHFEPRWANYYIKLADFKAQMSEDRSTKVGAVIVNDNREVSVGYNGFPIGVDQTVESRHERPAKYAFTEHAERNAIFMADRIPPNSAMFLNYAPCCCEDCTRAIIQTRITNVVGPAKMFAGKGAGEHYSKENFADQMKLESNVNWWVIHPNGKYEDYLDWKARLGHQ